MNFNFKKYNLLIIMLLIFVIVSCIVYVNMQNVKESFINLNDDYGTYFTSAGFSDGSYNYYKLNNSLYKYKLSSMPSGLIGDISDSGITFNSASNTYFNTKKVLLGYYYNNSDVSLIKINASDTILLDLSTIPLKIGNIDSSNIGTINMLFIENSGNFYDLSNNQLKNLTMKINAQTIIKDGSLVPKLIETPVTAKVAETAKVTATGGSVGDITISALLGGGGLHGTNNLDKELYAYLLSQGAYGNAYVPPMYNNFESAMNLPSNPLVNPVNSMNPLEYSQSLFGPNVTPMMAKNAYLNQENNTVVDTKNVANTKQAESSDKKSESSDKKFDSNSNLLSQNTRDNNTRDNNTRDNTTYDNTTYDNNITKLKGSCPSCPAPQRCPEPNFDCKKIPNYEQGIDNVFLPRPVLTDFSTFGM